MIKSKSFSLPDGVRHMKLAAAALLIAPAVQSQITTLPFHYTLFNPASTGLQNRQEFNASAFVYPGWGRSGYYANYQARIKPLHGALGVTYQRGQGSSVFSDAVRLNYSYHIKLGEQSTLAAGASFGVLRAKWPAFSGIHENEINYKFSTDLGVSFLRRDLHAGISVTTLDNVFRNDHSFTRAGLGYTLFVENTWQLSPNWKIRPSVMLISARGGGALVNVRATLKDRFWFGASASTSGYGAMVGYDFKNGMSLGYSIEVPYNGGFTKVQPSHGLTFRFRLP